MDNLHAVIAQFGHGLGLPACGVAVKDFAVQDDPLAVERFTALAERHPRLSRIGPNAGELAGCGIKANDPEAGGFCRASTECEIGLQESAAVDHGLMTRTLQPGRLTSPRVKRLGDRPIAGELLEEFVRRPVRTAARWPIGDRRLPAAWPTYCSAAPHPQLRLKSKSGRGSGQERNLHRTILYVRRWPYRWLGLGCNPGGGIFWAAAAGGGITALAFLP